MLQIVSVRQCHGPFTWWPRPQSFLHASICTSCLLPTCIAAAACPSERRGAARACAGAAVPGAPHASMLGQTCGALENLLVVGGHGLVPPPLRASPCCVFLLGTQKQGEGGGTVLCDTSTACMHACLRHRTTASPPQTLIAFAPPPSSPLEDLEMRALWLAQRCVTYARAPSVLHACLHAPVLPRCRIMSCHLRARMQLVIKSTAASLAGPCALHAPCGLL